MQNLAATAGRAGTRSAFSTLLVGLALLMAPSASAQPFDFDAPADSPLWWPVKAQLTPAELRASLLDPEANRARAMELVRRGVLPRPENLEAALTQIVVAVDRRNTPELWPVYMAFLVLSAQVEIQPSILKQLEKYGFSDDQVGLIKELVAEYGAKTYEWNLKLAPDSQEWAADLRKLAAAVTDEKSAAEIKVARKFNDVGFFATRLGKDPKRVEALLKADKTQPSEILFAETITAIRQKLGEAAWRAFCLYLEEVIMPRGGSMMIESNG